ncbi:MAG: NAD(P)-dependent oxidoreductase [Planctomycetota bacterium]|jgi:D-3-phosphoglycerate dehydrogenase
MKVLIADSLADWGIVDLKNHGCDVIYEPKIKGDALRDAIATTQCAVLVVRSTKVTGEMLETSSKLALVVRAGAGYNNIDVDTASRRSIMVANCPGRNAVAVAELTLGLILALDRRIADNVHELRAGVWNKKEFSKARGLKRRTLGLVGLGEIGKAVARRALAFEMEVAGWSRSLTEEKAAEIGIRRCDSIAELAGQSDILSVHLAANAETTGMIDRDVLAQLKPGSYLVNTSRAEVLDHQALASAVTERGIRVGLDVFEHEPGPNDESFADPIVNLDGVVYGTHHIGASTDQAQDAIARETIRIINHYIASGQVRNCVNLRAHAPGRIVLVVRHRNRPGVLAHTLNQISLQGINVEEMQNIICEGAEAACAQLLLDGPLADDALQSIQDGHEHIFAVTMSVN